jgi:hypothetical protein
MLTPIANRHRSKLPRPGAIVTVRMRRLQPEHRFRRFIVESYPLSDAADLRYSRGIHTCTLRALDNGERSRVSGIWCHDQEHDE